MGKPAKIRMNKIAPHQNRAFTVVPYDETWPKQYERLAERLRQIFGNKMLAIEHVGSTAVPGLAAKPQVDVVLVVDNLDIARAAYDAMRQAGFTSKGDYVGEGEEYFTEDTPERVRLASIHVLPKGHVWINDLVNVRDYLRAHPDEMKRYSDIKLKAAREHPEDYDAYYKSKVEIIQHIRQQAANWRAGFKD